VTFNQQTRGPANYSGRGKIKGFEVACQQTFDFLPGWGVNATIFYEKGAISLRVAYNWRSKFLLTAADVIFPLYLDLPGRDRTARRLGVRQPDQAHQDRRAGRQPHRHGDQGVAGAQGRSACAGAAIVFHRRSPLLVHFARQLLTCAAFNARGACA
jgi:hypothetical protein